MNLRQLLSMSACLLCLSYAAADAAGVDLSYGRQIILQRGLQIQSLAFVSSTPVALTDYSLWASANFTTFNSWNDKNSEKTLGWTMPWSRWIKSDLSNPLTNNETTQHLSELVSLQYGDELNQNLNGTLDAAMINTMAATFADWHNQYGNNFLAYTNFGANNAAKSMTPAALANYMQIANPDMLMFDAYPRHYVTLSTWYAEMQKYRLAGLAGIDGTGQAPIPYAQYLDLYRTSYSASQPSESFVRLQENASWAFGYTFVTAFVYNKPNNSTVYPTMFSSDGDSQPTIRIRFRCRNESAKPQPWPRTHTFDEHRRPHDSRNRIVTPHRPLGLDARRRRQQLHHVDHAHHKSRWYRQHQLRRHAHRLFRAIVGRQQRLSVRRWNAFHAR